MCRTIFGLRVHEAITHIQTRSCDSTCQSTCSTNIFSQQDACVSSSSGGCRDARGTGASYGVTTNDTVTLHIADSHRLLGDGNRAGLRTGLDKSRQEFLFRTTHFALMSNAKSFRLLGCLFFRQPYRGSECTQTKEAFRRREFWKCRLQTMMITLAHT